MLRREFSLPIDLSCVGRVGKYDASDGSTQWDVSLSQFSNIYGLEYDEANELLFFTAYHDVTNDAGDLRAVCPGSTLGCGVAGAMDATNGDILWFRSVDSRLSKPLEPAR